MKNVLSVTCFALLVSVAFASSAEACSACSQLCQRGGGEWSFTCGYQNGRFYNCSSIDGGYCNGCQGNADDTYESSCHQPDGPEWPWIPKRKPIPTYEWYQGENSTPWTLRKVFTRISIDDESIGAATPSRALS